MDNTKSVADWISKATAPSARTVPLLDLSSGCWTVELKYLTGSIAGALEQLLGPPDFRVPFFVKRWAFAGTTVVQRGRSVLVIGSN
jgi:hypothetical protein